jgi:hypothetical protein
MAGIDSLLFFGITHGFGAGNGLHVVNSCLHDADLPARNRGTRAREYLMD